MHEQDKKHGKKKLGISFDLVKFFIQLFPVCKEFSTQKNYVPEIALIRFHHHGTPWYPHIRAK